MSNLLVVTIIRYRLLKGMDVQHRHRSPHVVGSSQLVGRAAIDCHQGVALQPAAAGPVPSIRPQPEATETEAISASRDLTLCRQYYSEGIRP